MSDNVCEESVFKALFKKLSEPLRNYVYYKSGSLSVAEDITQEAYLRLWKACLKVSVDKSKSFLYTVASNLLKDHYKHKQVVLKFEKQEHKSVELETPEFNYEQLEFHERLERALAQLSEKNRVAFLMNRLDNLTYTEIAERLGISKKAVEKRIHKALMELKKLTDQI